MARKARGISLSTASRGSGTVRKRSVARSRCGASRGSPRSPATDRLSPPRISSSNAVWAEDPGCGVGGGPQRSRRLVLPAPGEAVLGPAARRTPAVHRPTACLRAHQPRWRAGEDADRVATQPHQQHADCAGRDGMRHDRLGGARRIAVVPCSRPPHRGERRMALGRRPVRRGECDRHARLIARYGPGAMTLGKRDDPGHQPFWRNIYPAAAASRRILHYAPP